MSQRLDSYFNSSPELRELTHRAHLLATLQRQFQESVPPTLANASRVIGYEQHVLTLGADNSAIAAKLRQLAPHILLKIQGNDIKIQGNDTKITGILVKVQVTQPPATHNPASHSLGKSGRQQIINLTANMPDSPLKSALQRLIKP